MAPAAHCWCGNNDLAPFSRDYRKCARCETLVLADMPDADDLRVKDDEKDFYGHQYYETHLRQEYHLPPLEERSRIDLPERCLHWLRTLLKYKLPPARLLELGSAHGGFVALLRSANFEATGLELSLGIVEYARRTFCVPMLVGPIEEQTIPPSSLDGILLMDVLEHLHDPVMTMSRCFDLSKQDGILLIQTPEYPENKTYEELALQKSRFLEHLKPLEHLFLFSKRSICDFFHRLGVHYLIFESAIFPHYDMFLVASRAPLVPYTNNEMEKRLGSTPQGRMIQAMIDVKLQAECRQNSLQDQIENLHHLLHICEADRSARLQVIRNYERSLSWRLTAPLRLLHARWNRYFPAKNS